MLRMGGDGGSVASRSDLVRLKGHDFHSSSGSLGRRPNTMSTSTSDTATIEQKRKMLSTQCALTEEALDPPLVIDRRGNIFNREAILAALLAKRLKTIPEFSHIRKMKDLRDLPITEMFDWRPPIGLQCQLTHDPFTATSKFYFNWNCEHLFSLKGLQKVYKKADISTIELCPVCSEAEIDAVTLNYVET